MLRVISRLFAWPDTQDREIQQKIYHCLVQRFPEDRASDFTQSLMELGALICVPRNPQCENCPIQEECEAYLQNKQEDWPFKATKAQPKKIVRYLDVIQRYDCLLMHRRLEQGLLAGLWELPGECICRK